MHRFTLSFLGFLFAATGTFASAATEIQCPNGDMDATVQLVEQSKTCAEAAKIARDCQWGSTADIYIAGAAIEICARDYTNMTKQEMLGYEGLMKKCGDKYVDQIGSLYRSFTSHCQLNVAELYSKVYSNLNKVEGN